MCSVKMKTPFQIFVVMSFMTFIHISALDHCKFVDTREKIILCNSSNESDNVLQGVAASKHRNATSLLLSGCNLSKLDRYSFQNLSSVKFLDISQNKLEELAPSLFDGVESLLYLNISNNLITNIPQDIFLYTSLLVVLDLKENKIEDFPVGIFDHIEKLGTLDLSWNNFLGRDLSPFTFKHNRFINYISFSGNDMNDTPQNLLQGVDALKTLDLNSCAIEEVPLFARISNLKSLKELILSSNLINKLDNERIFENFENLETLDLSDNDVDQVDGNVFKSLLKLKVLKLQNNRLTYLPDTIFQNLRYLENVDLSKNIMTKVSVHTFSRNSLRILNLSYNRFTYLAKNFCLELRNSGANLTEFYFHQNPWQCACLKDILNEAKELHLVHKTDTPGYKKPVCVTLGDSKCKRGDAFVTVFQEIYDKIKLVGTMRDSGFS